MVAVQSQHTPTPRQQVQDTEAAARAASGIEPGVDAAALEVIDDAARGDGSQPTRTQPAAEPAVREPPPTRGQFDNKRAEIVARFRSGRTTEIEEARDDITDFARSGMPPEFEPPAPAPEVNDAAPAPPAPAATAAPQKVKLKVRGVDQELPLDEVIKNAQIALAADSYLDEAKARLKSVETLESEARTRAQRTGQPGVHPAGTQQNGPHPAAAADDAHPETQPAASDDPQHPDDQLTKLIETLQFGDPAEAKQLLQKVIVETAANAAEQVNQRARLRDEGARSQATLVEYLGKHPDIASDPRARAVIEHNVYELQLADFKELGIDSTQFRTAHGGPPTAGDIAQAHQWYRANGFNVSRPGDLLQKAVTDYQDWKGVGQAQPMADPAKAAPHVDLTVDRTARRQAIPQQPSRTAMPKPGGDQPAPQARDRSAVVASMAAARGMPRGRIPVQ